MSKLKTILWCLLIAVIAVIVYQNEAFFMSKQVLTFKCFSLTYNTPYTPNGIFIVIFAFLAFLITYVNHIIFRIKINKTVKNLKAEINADNSNAEVEEDNPDRILD